MEQIKGAGSWPGRAEGRVVWYDRAATPERLPVVDRAVELLRFRTEWDRAVADVQRWVDLQSTLAGRLLLTPCCDALLNDAWFQRVCALINAEGFNCGLAIVQAATHIGGLLRRSPALREQAEALTAVARWLARRIDSAPLPPDAIIASQQLLPLEILDLNRPVIIAGEEPPITSSVPMLWGVHGLGPDWHGRRIAVEEGQIELDLPERPSWCKRSDRLGELLLVHLTGQGELDLGAAAAPFAVLIDRLDDLAAVPFLVERAAAVAIDLDRLGATVALHHPGVFRLLQDAVKVAAAAGIPLLAGGARAQREADDWLSFGFTALFHDA